MTTKLTKRNEDFVFHLEKLLKDDQSFDGDKSKEVISDVEKQLADAQKSGTTARQLFGTPSQYLSDLKDPKAAAARKKAAANGRSNQAVASTRYGDPKGPGLFDFSFLSEFVDTALSVFVLFSAIYAFVGLFTSSNAGNNPNTLGIITVILISLYGGLLYVYGLRRLIFDPKVANSSPLSFGRRILYLFVLIVMWIIGFLVLSLIPQVINPVLPAIYYVFITVIGYFGIRFWRQRTGLPNNLLSVSVLMRNSGIRAREAASRNIKNRK